MSIDNELMIMITEFRKTRKKRSFSDQNLHGGTE